MNSDTFNGSIWPHVCHNRQFFPKGSLIMSEGSLTTGIWIITHGRATRTITATSGSVGQQQLAVETLVPGQSVGWEEITLLMRPDFARQVPSPVPPSHLDLIHSACTSAHALISGTGCKHVERGRLERRSHNICSRKRN
jgi:hypothetical protein